MNIASIGIDLGKTTFHLVALGEHNKVLLRKKFSRPQLLAYTANLPSSLIGLEACAGAHFMGAALRAQGHQVRLIPAQFVKPYRKSNKNDLQRACRGCGAVLGREDDLDRWRFAAEIVEVVSATPSDWSARIGILRGTFGPG